MQYNLFLIQYFRRKLDEYELKETAARVVKSATKSFHMSPPQSGFSDVDTGNFFKKIN